jgi:hypothetical protein
MQVFPFPGAVSKPKVEPLEGALQRLAFPALPTGYRAFGCQPFQVSANKACQGCIPFYRDLPDLLSQFFGYRERDIHTPVIRESRSQARSFGWLFPVPLTALRLLLSRAVLSEHSKYFAVEVVLFEVVS